MESKKMKAYALGLYEKAMPAGLTWQEKLKAAGEAGYDFVEMSIDETDEKLARLAMSREERLALVRDMYETGVPVRSICLSGHRKYPLGSRDEAVRRRSLSIMEKTVGLADDLGVRIIMLAGYDVYYEESGEDTRKFFEENLAKAAEMAARNGVLLGFETMETEFMNTVGKAMGYVHKIDSPYLNVYPDSGNITNAAVAAGTGVCADLAAGQGHLLALHLKETAPGRFREVPYGTGHVDFASMIGRAWDLGVRRYVTEFWYTGAEDWKKDLASARERMGGLLDQAAGTRKEGKQC
jgi:L-ribulose-5-phosphate 3-epimerase